MATLRFRASKTKLRLSRARSFSELEIAATTATMLAERSAAPE
jgi:hypothetical protein